MRTPNARPRTAQAPGVTITLQPHELKCLRRNTPGPAGILGGYQNHENWLLDNTNDEGQCHLTAERLERTIRYIRNYGPGGPNGRIRAACVPALRRAGVDPMPEWAAPPSETA